MVLEITWRKSKQSSLRICFLSQIHHQYHPASQGHFYILKMISTSASKEEVDIVFPIPPAKYN